MAYAAFKIDDLYKLPDEDVRLWQDARDAILEVAFGMRDHEIDFDAVTTPAP